MEVVKKLPKLLDTAADRSLLAVGTVFLVLAALADTAIPHFAAECVTAVTQRAAESVFMNNLIGLAACSVAYATFAAVRGSLFSVLNQRLTFRLRFRLFSRLIRQDVAFFDRTPPGELTSRLTSDAQVISRTISTNINVALRNALQVCPPRDSIPRLRLSAPNSCASPHA